MGSQEDELELLNSSLSELKYLNPGAEFPVVEEAVKKVQADIVQAKQVNVNEQTFLIQALYKIEFPFF